MKAPFIAASLVATLAAVDGHGQRLESQEIDLPRRASVVGRLEATDHPPLPGHPSMFWLVPEAAAARTSAPSPRAAVEAPAARLSRGVKLVTDGEYAAALPLVSTPALDATPLAGYAQYYTGVAQLRLERLDEAAKTLKALAARDPAGHLAQAVALARAEVARAKGNPREALDVLEPLTREKTSSPETILMEFARAAEAAGDEDRAVAAYRRVYIEFALSEEAGVAKAELARLDAAAMMTPERFQQELGRAERLFAARKYEAARDAYTPLAKIASGDDKELVALRLAETDYYLRRHRAAREKLRPYLTDAKREAEARFFYLTATRALGDIETYVALARSLVNDFPQDSWAEETLNNLASHYIIENQDAQADTVFRELYRRFPQGRHAERAAWKIGWWAYKNGSADEAARIFEEAAAAFPRADYRPAWLYWSARAHDTAGREATATARYRLTATDYLNSYYGRLASKALAARKAPPVTPVVAPAAAPAAPDALVPTDALIRALIAAGLYDDALRELQYAQRTWGDSPAIQATFGWIYNRKGELRRGINAMKRAYPQYLAAGGEDLPADLLGVLFPLEYWPLIKKYSDAHRLDPYVIAALMAQESTFDHQIRSAANAYGLMQVVPGTGRRYARKLGMRRFSTRTLVNPEANVRIGTKYFRDLVDRFGGAHFALASYNAGEHRIARWIAERPGIAQDEFIDDIPFPETQNYVKKILGTAEDYRRLYGGGLLKP